MENMITTRTRTTFVALGDPYPGLILVAKLLEVRRPEQSGFTPHRSTVVRIVTLNTLLQTRREFNKPLWIAYAYVDRIYTVELHLRLRT